MKLQLNTTDKTIKIEGNVKLSDLVKHLEALLQKDSKMGYWKDYELEVNTPIIYWNTPVVIKDYTKPWWENPITYTTGVDSSYSTGTSSVSYIQNSSQIYNLELN